MFTGYELTTSTRNALLEAFPPKYERVICNHITEKYGIAKSEPSPSMPENIEVVGYIDSGDGIEGFLVEVNGSTQRPDGKHYHITHSIAINRKPVETNNYISDAVKIKSISLRVEPKNFW